MALAGGCTRSNPAFVAVRPGSDAGTELLDAPPLAPDLRAPPDEAPLAPDAAAAPDVPPPPDAALLAPDAAVLPRDAAPDLPADRSPPGTALLVIDQSIKAALDQQLQSSLTRLGFTVVVRDAPASVTADATGRSLVVISGSAYSNDIGSKFRDVPVPVVVFDDAVFPTMKMTGTRDGTDFGSVIDEDRIMIVNDAHPLAGGLSGQITIANGGLQVSWGVPSTSAIKVATVLNNPNRFTIFGYTEGSTMVGMTAPARRVGAFVRFPQATTYTESGLLLFEAAALWAISHLD